MDAAFEDENMITQLKSVANPKAVTTSPHAHRGLATLLLVMAATLAGIVLGWEIQAPWRLVTAAMLLCAAAVVK